MPLQWNVSCSGVGEESAERSRFPFRYRGDVLTSQRIDMIVDEKVVVEIKSTHVLPPTAKRQTLNYLRATMLEVGLLLHFGPEPKFYRFIQSNQNHSR